MKVELELLIFFFLNLSFAKELTKTDEIQGSIKHTGTWLHLTRLHSREEQSFQQHFGQKQIGVNESANSEIIFKTDHLSSHVIWKSRV